jgi:curved DNA-binding protein CbpA
MNIFEPFSTQSRPSRRALVRIDFTSDPASGSVTATAADQLAGNHAREVVRDLFRRARVDQVRRRHVGVHQHGDGEAAEGRAAELLGQQRGGARIQRAAAEFLRVAQAEEAEAAHLAQQLARHEALLFPGVAPRHHLLLYETADAFLQQPEGVVHRPIIRKIRCAGAIRAGSPAACRCARCRRRRCARRI